MNFGIVSAFRTGGFGARFGPDTWRRRDSQNRSPGSGQEFGAAAFGEEIVVNSAEHIGHIAAQYATLSNEDYSSANQKWESRLQRIRICERNCRVNRFDACKPTAMSRIWSIIHLVHEERTQASRGCDERGGELVPENF